MKSFLIIVVVFACLCGCTNYGFPYKTKVETEEVGNTVYIAIDSSEMIGVKNFIQLDRKIKTSQFVESNVWVNDSIQAFWIESLSDTFTVDFEFYFKRKRVQIDSFSFMCTFKDSVQIKSHKTKYGISKLYKFNSLNQIKFPDNIKLLQDLIIYSDEKTYRFINYFLWY